MIRVGMAIGQLTYGGAETQLYEVCRRLTPLGIEPIVYCLSENTEPYRTKLETEGIEVRVLPRSSHFDLKRGRTLAAAAGEDRVELLHSWLIDDNPYAWMAARARRIPLIASLRSRPIHRDLLRRVADRWVFRSANATLANSTEVRDLLIQRYGVPSEKVVVIENGLDLSRLRPTQSPDETRTSLGASPDDFLILFVGRLEPVKRVDILIEAFGKLKNVKEDSVLWVVGEGREREELRDAARKWELEGSVRFLGTREDMGNLYHAANLLVLCSYSEGLPNVVLESMACGTPALVSEGANCGKIVQNGQTGWVCGDVTPEGLAEDFFGISERPEECEGVGERAKAETLRRFSFDKTLQQISHLYQQVLKKPIK